MKRAKIGDYRYDYAPTKDTNETLKGLDIANLLISVTSNLELNTIVFFEDYG